VSRSIEQLDNEDSYYDQLTKSCMQLTSLDLLDLQAQFKTLNLKWPKQNILSEDMNFNNPLDRMLNKGEH